MTDEERREDEKTRKIFVKNLAYLMQRKGITQMDIMEEMDASSSTVSNWCTGLKLPRMGKMQHLANYLGVKISDLIEERDQPNMVIMSLKLYPIPLFKSISAGFGATAVDYIVDYVPLPFEHETDAQQCLCIQVDGDSMSPDIKTGDVILVRRQPSVDSGDVAAVLVDGDQGFVKKVVYDRENISLISSNPYYPPVEFHGKDVLRVEVLGKVLKVIRDYQ